MKKTIKLAKFDAELNTDVCDARNNADLTITLNLGFRQINPTGGAATGTYRDYNKATGQQRKIVKWTPGEWSKWKSDLIASAQKFWHGKFWLLNKMGVLAYDTPKGVFIPHFYCRFKLTGADAGAGTFHHVIDVVRLDKTENWFGSHWKLYDNLDTKSTKKGTDSAGNAIMQQAHVHEVGHLLGLPHVDVGESHCPATGNTNASACYGISDVDMKSVMGRGMRLDKEHAQPWRDALTAFWLKGDLVATKSFTPGGILALFPNFESGMRRVYPRTPDEFKAGKIIYGR